MMKLPFRVCMFVFCWISFLFLSQTLFLSCSGDECKNSEECGQGHFCFEGRCKSDCAAHSDCYSGYRCSFNGRCESNDDTQKVETTPKDTKETIQNKDASLENEVPVPEQEASSHEKKAEALHESIPEKPKNTCKQDRDCEVGFECSSSNTCVKKKPPCPTSSCVLGKTRCDGEKQQVCEKDNQGCGVWSKSNSCGAGKRCVGGKCERTCQQSSTCQEKEECKQGLCVACKSDCTIGDSSCSGEKLIYCQNQKGCGKWSKPASCGAGKVCRGGTCQNSASTGKQVGKECKVGLSFPGTKGDCASGLLCVGVAEFDLICHKPCSSNTDCPNGETCHDHPNIGGSKVKVCVIPTKKGYLCDLKTRRVCLDGTKKLTCKPIQAGKTEGKCQ